MKNRDYDTIPGTYIQDGKHYILGYHLNMFCMSLNKKENRESFKRCESQYLDKYKVTAEQKQAVLERNWLEMLRLGGNIYYTFKIAAFDGLTMQHVGAFMSEDKITFEEFQNMMLDGGRSIENNRHKKES